MYAWNRRSVVLGLIIFATPIAAYSVDKVTNVAVQFKASASTAEIKGSITGYDSVHYTLSAKAGQKMTVQIEGSSNANFNVFPPGTSPGSGEALGSGSVGADWAGELPASGKYLVQVFQMRASARRGEKVPYTITFEIR